MSVYSWRDFGREAEFLVASYLKLKGWDIIPSPSSRGAADMVASKGPAKWCIQVKASMKSPRIRSEEISRLMAYASSVKGIPVFASVQPWNGGRAPEEASVGPYVIFLYSIDDWKLLHA